MSSRTFHVAAGSQSWFEHAEERIDADVQTAAETGAPLAAFEAQEERLQSAGVEACLCEYVDAQGLQDLGGGDDVLLETEELWDLVVVVVRFQGRNAGHFQGFDVLLHGCR